MTSVWASGWKELREKLDGIEVLPGPCLPWNREEEGWPPLAVTGPQT